MGSSGQTFEIEAKYQMEDSDWYECKIS